MTHPLPPGSVISSVDSFGRRYDLELVLSAAVAGAETACFPEHSPAIVTSYVPRGCAVWTDPAHYCAWRPEA